MTEITSRNNEKLKTLIELAGSKKARTVSGYMVIDGGKLCMDAVATGHSLLELWITETAAEKYREEYAELSVAAGEVFVVRDNAAVKISQLKSPQGIWGVFSCPEWSDINEFSGFRRVLGICGVQNPENAGAMIRTAAALGYEGVLLSDDCSDIWSPRALRAGAGSQLNIPVSKTEDYPETVKRFNEMGYTTYASDLNRSSSDIRSVHEEDKILLIIGNEGHGIPGDVLDVCSGSIYLPMSNGVESLNANAAAAIMMWELQ